MSLASGTSLGPYKILAPLGAGGMGEVYRAHDTRLGRDVAIKVLPPHLAAAPEVRARFEREARTISQLSHPHICTLHDVGHQDGVDYLVMELVEGETLAHRLEKGPLPVAEVLALGTQIADALDRAHRAGVVHRDLKPGNIMLTKGGAKLMDFGLARAAGLAGAPGALTESPTVSRPLTAEGTIVGTFQYMAPEQLEGKEADARTDLWALGCVLYEMATGQRAFEGESKASLIAAILKETPRAISELQPMSPPALERAVKRCLMKDPDDRWQSARDVMHELQWIAAAGSEAGVPAVMGARQRSRVTMMLAAAAVLAILMLIAGHALWKPAPAPTPTYQRLTFRRGTIGHARFAPDGQTVVYDACWDGKPSEIFTLRSGNPESRPFGIMDAKLLAVSSSGELAVQLRPALWNPPLIKGTLARVPLGGGEPRAVREEVYDADWTADGGRMAVAPSDSYWFYVQLPLGTTIARSAYGMPFMRIAPDGRGVAFWRQTAANSGGSLALAEPGRPERVLCAIDYACSGMAWNPRTRELWYSEVDTAGSTSLRAVSMDGRRRRLLRLAGVAALQDIAADGRVLISLGSTRRAIQVLAPGQSEERDLSWLDRSSPYDLSLDGRMLVFNEEGTPGGRTGAVYLRPTGGSPAVRLGEGAYGALSPDRGLVAVWLSGPPPRLRMIPVGAGEARDVATGGVTPLGSPFYFPDGRHLLFVGQRGDSTSQLFAVPVEGGTPRPITPPGWGLWMGQRPLSPDGRLVAAADAPGANRIFPADGGPSRPAPGVAQGEVVLGWTGDSRGLYVFRRGEVPARIYRVDLATGRRQLWKELGPADRTGVTLIYYALIAADGRSYAYAFDRAQDNLYLVTGLK
jgi:hypothetical protein